MSAKTSVNGRHFREGCTGHHIIIHIIITCREHTIQERYVAALSLAATVGCLGKYDEDEGEE